MVADRVAHGLGHGPRPGPKFCPHPAWTLASHSGKLKILPGGYSRFNSK